MVQTIQRTKRTVLSTNMLVATLGITVLTLSGCSDPKSEMAEAINKYMSKKPDTSVIYVSGMLPLLLQGGDPTAENGMVVLVLPDAKNSPAGKAMADLASARLVTSKPIDVYPEKNPYPYPYSYMKEKTVYISDADKAKTNARNLISTDPIHAIAYSVPTDKDATISTIYGAGAYGAPAMNVKLGQWKLKSVDNFSKDKNPLFGGQIAQCTFQFEYDPKIKPLIHQFEALGVDEKYLPKPDATRPYKCIVSAMDKGYMSMGCSRGGL